MFLTLKLAKLLRLLTVVSVYVYSVKLCWFSSISIGSCEINTWCGSKDWEFGIGVLGQGACFFNEKKKTNMQNCKWQTVTAGNYSQGKDLCI